MLVSTCDIVRSDWFLAMIMSERVVEKLADFSDILAIGCIRYRAENISNPLILRLFSDFGQPGSVLACPVEWNQAIVSKPLSVKQGQVSDGESVAALPDDVRASAPQA